MPKTALSRRRFLARSAVGALAASVLPLPSIRTSAASPNERISIAVIGINGRGAGHLRVLSRLTKETRVAALCDVDNRVLSKRDNELRDGASKGPALYSDYRRVVDDKNVDAVVVATPNHWHAPIGRAAMEAGKDCYLEKPMSHTFHEGRLLVDAAKKYGRIVQHGTQTRASPVFAKAGEVLASGILGEVRMAKAWNLQKLRPIPARPDGEAPEGVDYDRWLGPAPKRAFNPNRFHKTWHQYIDYGNGDLGDDGPHDVDVARWGLGTTTHPVKITAHGSRTHIAGEREFPDNMQVAYEYEDGKVLLYEERIWTPYGEYGFDNANAFYGTEGRMIFSRRGHFQVYLGRKDEKGPGMDKVSARGEDHMLDFLSSIRTREAPLAPAEEGHLTCGLVHLGLLAARVERVLHFDPKKEQVIGDPEANALLTKKYRTPWGMPS